MLRSIASSSDLNVERVCKVSACRSAVVVMVCACVCLTPVVCVRPLGLLCVATCGKESACYQLASRLHEEVAATMEAFVSTRTHTHMRRVYTYTHTCTRVVSVCTRFCDRSFSRHTHTHTPLCMLSSLLPWRRRSRMC